jgi:biotin carboxyl carrier protein
MNFEFVYKGEVRTVELKDNRLVSFGDGTNPIEVEYTPDGRIFIKNGVNVKEIYAAVDGDKTFVDIDGALFEFTQPSQDAAAAGEAAGDMADPSKVFAPMPGKIVKIMVNAGDVVEPKQHLVIVEAMKMENIIIAGTKAMVRTVNFKIGDQVDTDHPIIELELQE